MEREGKELKSRDKIVLKNTKEGLIEHNLSKDKTKNISKKIEDIDLKRIIEYKRVESLDLSKSRRAEPIIRKKQKLLYQGISRQETLEADMKDINIGKTIDKADETFILDEPVPTDIREELDIDSELEPYLKPEPEVKLNHKKKYKLAHKGRYKQKEISINQDLNLNKENLDISKDNPKEKLDQQKRHRIKINNDSKNEATVNSKDKLMNKTVEKTEKISRTSKNDGEANKNDTSKKGASKFKQSKDNKKNKLYHQEDEEKGMMKNIFTSATSITAGFITSSTNNIYHSKMDEVEDENVGVKSTHQAQEVGERALRKTSNYSIKRKNRKLKKEYKDYGKTIKLRDKLEFNKVLMKDKRYQELSGISRYIQKWRFKKQYNQRVGKSIGKRLVAGIKGVPTTIKGITKKVGTKAGAYIMALVFLFLMIMVTVQSCSNILMGGLGTIAGTSFQASDLDVTGADVEYTRLETGLLLTLQDIEIYNLGYDEYRYNLDGVGHDPHELIAYLTAKYGDFKTSSIIRELQMIFTEQYKLSLQRIIETYTTTETFIDSETGEEYEEEVEHEKIILLTTLISRPLNEVLIGRLDRDKKELYDVLMTSKGNFMTYASPVDGDWKQYISSMFGWRIHPIQMVENFHTGLDIAKPEGEPLYAIFEGTVKEVGYESNGYGHYIVIEDKAGNTALYAHCSSINVSQGSTIKNGDIIATIGSTGSSTGPHLHLELEDSDRNLLNPYFYLYSEAGSTIGTGIYYNGYRGNYGSPGIPYDNDDIQALFNEADKHLGKRYIFGANGPNNFDCSSFVSWVFRNSGIYNIPRTTAQGIFNTSTPISASEAKAGDIIFFTGTYNAGVPVTHVGIYAGNGMMVHAGDPIQYTSIETNYWKNHFYSFGRLR